MRTLLVRVEGEVEPGDLVILQFSDRYRGGQSNARGHVRPTRDTIEVVNGHKQIVEHRDTLKDVLSMIVHQVNSQWGSGHFTAKQRNDNEIVIQALEGSGLNFYYSLEGSKKQTVTIEDLA
jgi:hypothetical protein